MGQSKKKLKTKVASEAWRRADFSELENPIVRELQGSADQCVPGEVLVGCARQLLVSVQGHLGQHFLSRKDIRWAS